MTRVGEMEHQSRASALKGVIHGALLLGSGAALGQLVMLLSTPLVSRIYTPAAIGEFALYSSFVSVGVTLAPLGFHRALPTTATKEEASQLATGILLAQPALCAFLGLLQLYLIRGDILGFGELPPSIAWFTGFSVIANTLLVTLQFWFVRAEEYQVIARVPLFQNVGRASSQVAAGLAGFSLVGLVVGDFVGRLLGLSGMLRRALPHLSSTLPIKWSTYRRLAGRYRKFLFPQLPSSLLNMGARMLPLPVLVALYGAETAGMYAMADRLLQAPVALLSKSIGDALHGRLAALSRENPREIQSLFFSSSLGLLAVGLVPTLLLMLWGEPLFAFVLGGEWGASGRLAVVLAPLALANLVVATSSRFAYVFEAFWSLLLFNSLYMAAVIGALVLGGVHDWGVIKTVTYLSGFSVLAY
ncbi:MAG: oligosaccharide flippase family protein, partial [Dehalococcoidia bacterium]